MTRPQPIIHPGDRVQMRKPHPCGSSEWLITRVGTDIGLLCAGCRRRVMLTRSDFNRQCKTVLSRAETKPPLSVAESSGADDQGVP